MRRKSRNRSREGRELQRELESAEFKSLLGKAQQREPFMRRFKTWHDVVAFMRAGTSVDPDKDHVLRAVLSEHIKDRDPGWRHVLLVIFWPALESIRRQKRHWDADQDELWQNLAWTFLKVVCRVNPETRPNRLVQKIFNDTVHYLYEDYSKQRRAQEAVVLMDPESMEGVIGPEDIDLASIELREHQEAATQRLRAYLEEGHITEADFLLLVGTRVYGRSVADYARETGGSYEAMKKRRQRAEAAIRRAAEKEMTEERE